MSLTSSTFSLLCEEEAQFDSINTGLGDKPFGVPPSPGSCSAVAQPLPRCPRGVMGTGLTLGGILASQEAQVLWAAPGQELHPTFLGGGGDSGDRPRAVPGGPELQQLQQEVTFTSAFPG